jgi:transcriptional regulator with XRE-family HTH domain
MKIAAITKFKNGEIFLLLQKLGWNQSELARRSGIDATRIGQFLNLRRKPCAEHIQKLQFAFGEAGEFLNIEKAWPEDFKGLPKTPTVVQIADVQLDQIGYQQHLQLLQKNDDFSDEFDELWKNCSSDLTERQRRIMELRYGLNGERKHEVSEVAEMYNVTPSWVRQLECDALPILVKGYSKMTRIAPEPYEPDAPATLIKRLKQHADNWPPEFRNVLLGENVL